MRLLVSILSLGIIGLATSCDKPSKKLRDDSGKLEILFLGHNSEHHNSAALMPLLAAQLSVEKCVPTIPAFKCYWGKPKCVKTLKLLVLLFKSGLFCF